MHKVQRDLVPSHRKIVTDWMLEVGLRLCGIGGPVFFLYCNFQGVLNPTQYHYIYIINIYC